MRQWYVATALALLVIGCGSERGSPTAAGEADGLWLLSFVAVDGKPVSIEEPMFLEVDGDEVSGNTVCNEFGGEFGGDYSATTEGCEPDDDPTVDLHRVQDAMIEAVLSGQQDIDERLTFTTSSARLVYEQVEDPAPVQLFAVLDDASRVASTDEIYLDPEAGRHPRL